MAEAVEKRLSLFPRQRRFVTDPRRFPAYIGGIGSGKTYGGAAKTLLRVSQGPGIGLVAAPTYAMLRDATLRTLFDLFDSMGLEWEQHKGANLISIPRTGHEILYRSLDNPENLRGPNLMWAWVDEGSLITGDAWRIVKGRLRVVMALPDGSTLDPQGWNTMTPKGRNYAWEEWERDATGDETDPTHPLYRVATWENPTLPEDFVGGLGYSGNFALQELEGQFVTFEGIVYAMFRRKDHVRHIPPEDLEGMRSIMGVDIGTRNPTAILTLRGARERWHIEREVYQKGMDSEQIVAAVAEEYERVRPEVIYVDPSALAYIQTWRTKGLPVEKANNDVKFGIGEVSAEWEAGMTVDPSCVNTITEAENYHYPDRAKVLGDVPAKEGDHAMDALRYAIASEATVPTPRIYV